MYSGADYFFSSNAENDGAKFNYFQIILLAESSISVRAESSSQVDKEDCAITVPICFQVKSPVWYGIVLKARKRNLYLSGSGLGS